MKRNYRLSTIITVFGCIVVLVSLLVTDMLITATTSERIRANQEDKAQIVSRTVAESQVVKESLVNEEKAGAVQTYAEEVQSITDMMFVVVMDMNGIRYTHPNPEQIGKSFAGGDEQRVLQGKEYVSTSEGTLGDSVRAFTPIHDDDGNQLGAVAVGISLENVEHVLSESHRNIVEGSILGIIVGVIGAVFLAKYIKKMLFGLEPYQISKLLEERSTMLQSVHEGIVAVDENQNITLVNKSALRLFKKAGLPDQPIGMNITDFMPNTKLDRVLEKGESERDEEQTLNGIEILANREPLMVNQQIVGAIATFRDKSEVNKLAKQLTGVRTYVEALRAQSHEFMNRLHVILGMVQMEAYDELVEFIRKIIDLKNQDVESVTKSVRDPVLAGFLMGKISYAREKKVMFTISSDTKIDKEFNVEVSQELITIIGNLVDNAVEELSASKEKKLSLRMKEEKSTLRITISDSGPGITEDNFKRIFDKGFSTKGSNRGYGLYLVKQSIEKLNGNYHVYTDGKGTVFEVMLDYDWMRDGMQNDD
ncbi:DcuS/MalK family sensor histidine kinase [Virgibacillus xinjiangensis]|uniref:histidine kinase n=1 Tax=Virgibacillus xinjiangensis TaxID=393090 RepID=A0ABV7CSW3_9BACI